MSSADLECASLILATFPRAMRTLAHDMRSMQPGQCTMPQYRILGYLYFHGSDSMGRLAERQGVTLPTMTKMVAGLVERGMVERQVDELDRRVVRLSLTDAGQSVFETMNEQVKERLAAVVAQMNEPDRAALIAGLRAFHRIIAAEEAEVNVPAPAGTRWPELES